MIQRIADFIVWLINLLPSDPILSNLEEHTAALSKYMSYVNYFVPFYGIIDILELWCAGLFAYYMFVTNKELLRKLLEHLLASVRGLISKLFSTGGGES